MITKNMICDSWVYLRMGYPPVSNMASWGNVL